MHILITGAAGMIGRKLTTRLVADRTLGGKSIDRLTLVDIGPPQRPDQPAQAARLGTRRQGLRHIGLDLGGLDLGLDETDGSIKHVHSVSPLTCPLFRPGFPTRDPSTDRAGRRACNLCISGAPART